ncbi:hypothetical protein GIB67_031263 [Kingdonia uniflora]|uniref:Uncharacterized protein n=1 Tax=Kingdonia uniflora TaxID=39325 RepID=A0A7J7LQF7_9MAGN|nr:hypothetical protein GIB67_031263 [Kingdonia uniflora]
MAETTTLVTAKRLEGKVVVITVERAWGSGHSFDCDTYGMDVKGIVTMFSSACSLKGVALNVKHVSDAVFLASDESTFVSGLNLAVDSCFRLSALA